jgi:hypothetical protein
MAALALMLLGAVGAEVHGRGVVPDEEGLAILVGLVDEAKCRCRGLVIDGFHPFLRQWPSILDLLTAFAVGPAVEYASRAEVFLELGVLGIVRKFRFFLGIEVVEIADELVEAVHGRQKLVSVTKVILAELASGVAQGLEQLGDGRIFLHYAQIGAWQPHLRQPRTDGILPCDERGTSGRATLLGVVVGEGDAFVGDPVDVGRPVAHLAPAVVTDVPPADVIAP